MGQCEYILLEEENLTIQAENIPCDGSVKQVSLVTVSLVTVSLVIVSFVTVS